MHLFPAVALTMVAFAANSVLNRMALAEADTGPLAFAVVRLVSGTIVLVALVVGKDGVARLRRAVSWPKAGALALYVLGFSLAYGTLDAGLGALLLFGGVQLTMFAGAWLGGDRLGLGRVVGGGIALAGLVWLLWPDGALTVPVSGALLMLAAAFGWGIYSLLGRGARDPLATTAMAFALAAGPVALAGAAWWDAITWAGAGLAVLSGGITSGLGYALWYRLLPQMPAAVAAVAQLSVPPIAIAGGAVLLGETPGLKLILATGVILGGIFVAVWIKPKQARG